MKRHYPYVRINEGYGTMEIGLHTSPEAFGSVVSLAIVVGYMENGTIGVALTQEWAMKLLRRRTGEEGIFWEYRDGAEAASQVFSLLGRARVLKGERRDVVRAMAHFIGSIELEDKPPVLLNPSNPARPNPPWGRLPRHAHHHPSTDNLDAQAEDLMRLARQLTALASRVDYDAAEELRDAAAQMTDIAELLSYWSHGRGGA